jgi:hypothetical protein
VEKTLVLTVSYTAIRAAPRRKAGVELRGARVESVRPDVPAADAARLDQLAG